LYKETIKHLNSGLSAVEGEFLGLLNENRQRILRICRVYAWNPQDQEDLYQEVLFQIWRALPNLKEKAHANTWLYRVALNTAISFVRKQSAAGRRSTTPVEHDRIRELAESRQPHPPPHNAQIDSLYEAIGQLDKMEKAIITLFLEDLSYEQIGEVLGLNPGHVGVMLHRAKKKLSLLMKEEVTP
jgi:RNA polymerase sigma-70 factor (ECF subfamily)